MNTCQQTGHCYFIGICTLNFACFMLFFFNVSMTSHLLRWMKSPMAEWLEQLSQWHETYCHDLEGGKSLMVKWLEQTSQWHEMYCHDLEGEVTDGWVVRAGVSVTWNVLSWIDLNVMISNSSQVELVVRRTSALSHTRTETIMCGNNCLLRKTSYNMI